MSKRFLLVLVAIAVGLGAIFFFTKDKSTSTSSGAQPSNHVKGGGTKNVTLVEYGDYQCPACGAFYPILNHVYDKYQNDIHFQFRNFPLTSIHPNAFVSARAAEAADKQGKFWEMYSKLYENQQAWSASNSPNSYFEQYASDLGLDVNKFKQDLLSSEVNALINADIKEATKLGADSTPTFVLEGKKIDQNPRDLESFSKLIDEAITAKNQQ